MPLAPQLLVRLCVHCSHPMMGFCLSGAWACLAHAVTVTMSSDVQLPCCLENSFLDVINSLWLSQSFCLFHQEPWSLRGEKCDRIVSFRAEHPVDFYSLQVEKSGFSVIFCFTGESWLQRIEPIYGNYNKIIWRKDTEEPSRNQRCIGNHVTSPFLVPSVAVHNDMIHSENCAVGWLHSYEEHNRMCLDKPRRHMC